ncbi:CotS family spore coat protein [Candidatus Formimonas warabiya]|uniref:CotS family spore coat protein n=1 Tax=Formimonas warabiya TaxID=1761012 RepID=UPI0011D14AAC|nr:CotS family spore coat protein [Candidatus Formimonas warabiya]
MARKPGVFPRNNVRAEKILCYAEPITPGEIFDSRGEENGDMSLCPILCQYGIDPLQIVSHDPVYKIFAQKGNYALKKISTDPARLIFFLAAMDYLWQRGFFRMSKLVKALNGDLFTQSGTDLFFLTEWVEGRYINFSRREELEEAVRLLADLHRLGEGFSPPEACVPRNDIGRWPEKWRKRIADLETMSGLSESQADGFDIIFHRMCGIWLEDAYRALDILESSGYRAYSGEQSQLKPLCHRDFVYHNIIYTGQEGFLIDFEYCVQDSRLTDLARFLRTNWRNHRWERDGVQEILSVYHGRYPLSPTEQRLLPAVLMFPHEVWRAGHRWYFSRQRKKSVYDDLSQQYQCHREKQELLNNFTRGFILPPRS